MITTTALLLAITVHAGEQKVYKCNGADGAVTFSAVPCGSNAQEMHVEVTRKSPPPSEEGPAGSAAPAASAAAPPSQSDAIRDISDSVADSDCRRAANRLYIEPDTTEIDQLYAQVRSLESSQYVSVRTGTPNAHSQMMEQEDRARAATLRNTIALKEQQNATIRADGRRAVREALVRCDEQRTAREKARSGSK